MTWRLLSAILLVGFVFAGSAVPVQAAMYMENFTIPVEIQVFNECALEVAGEYILLTGNMQLVFFELHNKAGYAVYKSQVNPAGLAGYGETSGVLYRGTGMSQGISTVKDVNDVNISHNTVNFVGPGPNNNSIFQSTVN